MWQFGTSAVLLALTWVIGEVENECTSYNFRVDYCVPNFRLFVIFLPKNYHSLWKLDKSYDKNNFGWIFLRHSAVSCCARTTPDGDSVSSYCGWLLSSILYCRESAVSWRWWMSPWRSYEARRGTWPTEWRSWSTVSGLVQTQVDSCNRRAWETNTPELLQFNVVTNK